MTEHQPEVGEIIESHCRRCNDRTGHAIVSFVDGAVAKVQCRACGSVHKHYADKSKARTSSSKASKPKAKSKAGSKKASKAPKAPAIDPLWEKRIQLRDTSQAKPYSMDCQCGVDELLEHFKFGTGIVQELVAPNKAKVLFKEGQKLLRCAPFQKA